MPTPNDQTGMFTEAGAPTIPPAQKPGDAAYTDVTQQSPSSWEQLGGMISSGNPLMQRAETRGKQYAGSRGLLNSSLAAGATQGAMVDAATPFALQDAGNAADLLADRQRSDLTRGEMGVGHGYDVDLVGVQTDADIEKMGVGHGYDVDLLGEQTAAEKDILGVGHGYDVDLLGEKTAAEKDILGVGHQYDLGLIDAKSDAEIKNLVAAADIEVDMKDRLTEVFADQEMPQNLIKILSDQNMSGEEKAYALDVLGLDDGFPWMEYGEEGAPTMPSGTDDGGEFSGADDDTINDLRSKYGSFVELIKRGDKGWKSDEGMDSSSKDDVGVIATQFGYYDDFEITPMMKKLYGSDYTKEEAIVGNMTSDGNKKRRARMKKVIDYFGTYDNAIRAARAWEGDEADEKVLRKVILEEIDKLPRL